MDFSGAGGKLIHEKNQKQKISWHCPFKVTEAIGLSVLRIRIRIHMFLGLLDPDPSIIKYGTYCDKNLDFYCFVTSFWLFIFEKSTFKK
jgi:hypothetical protein